MIMTNTILRHGWILLPAILAPLAAFAAPPPHLVPAQLTRDGATQMVMLADRPLRLKLGYGSVRLPVSAVRRLEYDSLRTRYRVESAMGDVWLATVGDSTISLSANGTIQELPLKTGQIQRLELSPATVAPATAPRALIVLRDGSQFAVDAATFTLTLVNGSEHWTLPAASIESMSRANPNGLSSVRTERPRVRSLLKADTPDWWLLRFPGHTDIPWSGALGETTMGVTDLYGNSLALLAADIIRIDGRIDLPHTPSTSTSTAASPTPDSLGVSGNLQSAIAGERPRELPFNVWIVDTARGKIHLPTPLLAGWRTKPNGATEVASIFGDRLGGQLTPRSIPESNGRQNRVADLRVDNTSFSRVPAKTLPVPADARAWVDRDGNVLIARFAETSLAWRVFGEANPTTLSTRNIQNVTVDADTFTIETADRRLWRARPVDAHVSLILLATGTRLQTPWSAIAQVATRIPARADTATPPPLGGMVRLAGGVFLMGPRPNEGLPDEQPRHALTIAPFDLDRHEVTHMHFAQFVDATKYRSDAERSGSSITWKNPGFLQQPDDPVVGVSWHDAVEFCNWRSKAAKLDPCYAIDRHGIATLLQPVRNGFRLPTEAEWEFAARGGLDIRYPWGDDASATIISTHANYSATPGAPADDWLWTNPVLALPPTATGLYGMAGNVWEWCEDWYFDQAYASIHRQRPLDPCVRTGDVAGLTSRVMRGGSFDNPLELLRCSGRGHGVPTASATRVGFRCARRADLPATP
jgi:sulfatase modifying factor 1